MLKKILKGNSNYSKTEKQKKIKKVLEKNGQLSTKLIFAAEAIMGFSLKTESEDDEFSFEEEDLMKEITMELMDSSNCSIKQLKNIEFDQKIGNNNKMLSFSKAGTFDAHTINYSKTLKSVICIIFFINFSFF